MIEKIRDRMDRFAEKMARYQSVFFLNLFYILLVPVAFTYLKIMRKDIRSSTGFFQEAKHKSNDLEDHLKQY